MDNFPEENKPLPLHPAEDQLTAIGAYLLDALSLEEACIMTGYPFKDMKVLVERDPLLATYIKKKKIEFKHAQLKAIKEQPGKHAQWLLETLIPEEFGRDRGIEPPPSVNIVQLFMKDIQSRYDLPGSLVQAEQLAAPKNKKNVKDSVEYSVESALN